MLNAFVVEINELDRRRIADSLKGRFEIAFPEFGKNIRSNLEKNHYDLIILDLGSNLEEGIELIEWSTANLPVTPIIAISRLEDTEAVVKSIKAGAFGFVPKPFTREQLLNTIEKAMEDRHRKNEIDYLRREQDVVYQFEGIVAECQTMKQVIRTLRKFSRTDSTILMTGETGTGKSFLSGTIHFNSHRKNKPFVKINCANLPETLLESELFGHEKGAFTGADKLRVGRFEQAEGGTIFLDEIGEISLGLQAKLLRVLEDKSFERIGGNKTIHSNVRVIAATNRNLEQFISDGKFRQDLYYRINILSVHLPPLRDRIPCIEPIALALLEKLSRSLKKQVRGFAPGVIQWFQTYQWPGNIRQLANVIERGVILEDSPFLQAENVILPEPQGNTPSSPPAISKTPMHGFTPLNPSPETEREMILKALEQTLWIQKDASELLGVSPRTLNYKVKKFGITHPRWRKNKG
jgi:DNA-binding NtrC family response regulator